MPLHPGSRFCLCTASSRQKLELSPVGYVRALATYLQGGECSLSFQEKNLCQNDALNCHCPYRKLRAALATNIVKKVEVEARKNLQEHYTNEATSCSPGRFGHLPKVTQFISSCSSSSGTRARDSRVLTYSTRTFQTLWSVGISRGLC